MGHGLILRGHRGRIKVGYQLAATLSTFALTPEGDNRWAVNGSLVSSDSFWVAQMTSKAPTLELEVGLQRWVWRDVQLSVDGSTVHGVVRGRPERR